MSSPETEPVATHVKPRTPEPAPHSPWRGLCIAAVAGLVAWLAYLVMPYADEPRKGLALLIFIGILWLTEAFHVSITALLVPVVSVLLGFKDFNTTKALAAFADPVIFLFFGGFALATALHAQRLDHKIALGLLAAAGGRMGIAALYLFLATAGLSMWISNTATAAMMLPLALGLLAELKNDDRNTKVFLLLGIAYSASLGGLGTLVGSPPNAIAARALNMDFAGWMRLGLPLMCVLLPVMLVVLYTLFRPRFGDRVSIAEVHIPWTTPRIMALVLFACTALAWIFSSRLARGLHIASADTVIALMAAILVVALGLANWRQISENTDWGVLYLFGGGLTLSAVLRASGASAVLGQQVAALIGGVSPFVMYLIVAIFIVFLTEFTSNTASAALLVPVFAAIAEQMGLPPKILVLMIGIGASLAFMMPVATPPNAIVFATGHIRQRDMLRAGFVLNLICSVLLATWGWLFF